MLSRGMEESRCSAITSSIGEEQTIEQHYIHLYLSLAASTPGPGISKRKSKEPYVSFASQPRRTPPTPIPREA